MRSKRFLTTFLWLALPLAACTGHTPPGEPPLGASDFISAGAQQGSPSGRTGDYADGAAPSANSDEQGGGRTVEEGDIYRVLGPDRLLNLNSYRGLQVIDLADVQHPKVLGRVAVSGYPVEMYVVDQRAFVLLNNWYGYYGARNDVRVDAYQGGLVLAVDLSDPANPTITGRAQVPGTIMTSRLTRGGGKEALFVAASNWNSQATTVVRSFAVSGEGKLQERTTLDLGGYVVDVQATPEALLVARSQWDQSTNTYAVAVIDIRDPDGNMVEGASVNVAGAIKNKTNMDLTGGVLRVASGSLWGGTGVHLQTWNVADIQNPIAIDQKEFAAGEDLYASIFLEDRAFCVTYHRVDPFHAFAIDPQGLITEKSQYVISGWNDYFTPVLGATRLVGIGVDDQNGRKMAASLYDITDLANPNPFVSRASVEFATTWSEAQWDDRAFSVLEDAVAVAAPSGALETGLVLLPFNGYDQTGGRYFAGVQIFTFSATTLTKRGVMEHGTQVRRSFMQRDGVAANLSEQKLSLYDPTNPDSPAELGRLDLAPNYTDFFVFGSYGARLKYDVDYYSWWGPSASTLPDNQLQIIPLGADPDLAAPVATVSLPARAQLFQVGQLAVAITTDYIANTDPAQYSSEVRVYDLGDPTSPQLRSTFTTDKILPYDGYGYGWYGPAVDCWDCGPWYYGYGSMQAKAVGQALVFPSAQWQNESLGTEHVCTTWANEASTCTGGGTDCTYVSGNITCSSLNGGPESCQGFFSRCTYGADGNWSCDRIDPSSVQTQTSCYDQEATRYWNSYTFSTLDLRDPAQPVMAADLAMPATEDDASFLASGTSLYVTFRVPVQVPGDGRPYVRYYFKRIDLGDPQSPAVGTPVNIPGELIQVDGATITTRDTVWGDNIVETAVNRLEVAGDHAYLQARRRFHDEEVHNVLLDGNGHVLVTHAISWYAPSWDSSQQVEKLSILDPTGASFPVLSDIDVDSWATLTDAKLGRALFSVPGGLLVINVQDATAPYAQAYFALQGWPSDFVVANADVYIPAGPYGMYRFDLDAFNLLERAQ
jgi:hypothetical protein